jgi:hypothetical protein
MVRIAFITLIGQEPILDPANRERQEKLLEAVIERMLRNDHVSAWRLERVCVLDDPPTRSWPNV